METGNHRKTWSTQDTKSLTQNFINHVYDSYYKNYRRESEYYEKINNGLFILVTILGFFVTITLGLKEMFKNEISRNVMTVLTIIAFILPSISSVILVYISQKGFKRKEQIREDARIKSKYLVNEAKIRFSTAQNVSDFQSIHNWLNQEIRQLQHEQAKGYFIVHNNATNPRTN